MRIQGILRSVTGDGYNRLLEIATANAPSSLWVSALEPEQWLVPGEQSPHFLFGQSVDLDVVLRYVIAPSTYGEGEPLGLRQPINGSSHTVLLGQVLRVQAEDSFDCSVGHQSLRVELEKGHSLNVNQFVKVSGELAVAG